ncbi:hypothetical protein DFH09DRAFT_833136, partial [Mycena vulgaris]
LDHLLSTLLTDVLPYYVLKQHRQDLGFEGVDIEVKKRSHLPLILINSRLTQHIEDGKYLVPSKSDPSHIYKVDMDTYTRNCLNFP